jgi:RHS repeat-associated protein
LYLSERNIYGSSRIGMELVNQIIASQDPGNVVINEENGIYSGFHNLFAQKIGDKRYELSNHLGNVLEVITDRKLPIDFGVYDQATGGYTSATTDSIIDYYSPDVISQNDYYPFGMLLPNRHEDAGEYRYGFNGMEKDDEVSGEGNSYDFGARFYNSRVGRWLSVDPMVSKYPNLSPYNYVSNTPINAIDPNGEWIIFINGLNLDPSQGGNPNYWRTTATGDVIKNWDIAAMIKIGDFNASYVDGSGTNTAVDLSDEARYKTGYYKAMQDAPVLINNLEKDENGNIVETIKIVTHSMGGVTGRGYTQGLLDYVSNYNESHKDAPIRGFQIEFVVDLAPYFNDVNYMKPIEGVTTYRATGESDWLASDQKIEGVIELSLEGGTGHFLFNTYQDGTKTINPSVLPESKDKVKVFRKIYEKIFPNTNKKGKDKKNSPNKGTGKEGSAYEDI